MKMARLVVASICVMVLAQGLWSPAVRPCRGDGPGPLPDLYIVPGEFSFSVGGVATLAAVKGNLVSISALVANAAPGNITSAVASFFCGTALLGMTPIRTNFSGYPELALANFIWDTSFADTGNHTIRVEVNASGGDANMTNNSAEAVFRVTPAPPSMELSLEPGELQVVVTETMNGQATFIGTIRMQGLDGSMAVVNLEARLDTGWFCMCSPSTIVIYDDSTHSFSVSVVVPEQTMVDLPGELNVTARATGPGYQLNATARALATPMPYYRVMIESDIPYIEIAPGNIVTFTFSVTNKGNAIDSYEIEIINLKDLVNNHWTLMLSTSEVKNVAPGESRNVRLTAQSPRDPTLWKEGPAVINIRATSEGAWDSSLMVSYTFPVYPYERGSYPLYYNWWTIGLTVAILAALAIAVAWRWRSKRKKAAAGKTGEPDSR